MTGIAAGISKFIPAGLLLLNWILIINGLAA
jgi:hypothetical protein